MNFELVSREDYNSACHHADRGWAYLAKAVEALHKIASFREGEVVTSLFDEPGSATIARAALYRLPNCGVYEDAGLMEALKLAAKDADSSAVGEKQGINES